MCRHRYRQAIHRLCRSIAAETSRQSVRHHGYHSRGVISGVILSRPCMLSAGSADPRASISSIFRAIGERAEIRIRSPGRKIGSSPAADTRPGMNRGLFRDLRINRLPIVLPSWRCCCDIRFQYRAAFALEEIGTAETPFAMRFSPRRRPLGQKAIVLASPTGFEPVLPP